MVAEVPEPAAKHAPPTMALTVQLTATTTTLAVVPPTQAIMPVAVQGKDLFSFLV